MKVLYYAMGGGLGHLVRARAFLHAELPGHVATLLTASPFADDARVLQGLPCLRVPDRLEHDVGALRAWLAEAIATQAPELVCIDTFPGGILGELCDFLPLAHVRTWHLARLLRWETYARVLSGAAPRFARSYRLESLDAAHEAFLAACSDTVEDCALTDESRTEHDAPVISAPFWLVVHSGPEAEVMELVEYAQELQRACASAATLVVASPNAPRGLPAQCHVVDCFPATPLFDRAERIVSAAGFNILRQTAHVRHKHSILPFPRRYDDQYLRAQRAAAAPGAPATNPATTPSLDVRTGS